MIEIENPVIYNPENVIYEDFLYLQPKTYNLVTRKIDFIAIHKCLDQIILLIRVQCSSLSNL